MTLQLNVHTMSVTASGTGSSTCTSCKQHTGTITELRRAYKGDNVMNSVIFCCLLIASCYVLQVTTEIVWALDIFSQY